MTHAIYYVCNANTNRFHLYYYASKSKIFPQYLPSKVIANNQLENCINEVCLDNVLKMTFCLFKKTKKNLKFLNNFWIEFLSGGKQTKNLTLQQTHQRRLKDRSCFTNSFYDFYALPFAYYFKLKKFVFSLNKFYLKSGPVLLYRQEVDFLFLQMN